MRVLRFRSKKVAFCLIILFAHPSIDAFFHINASIDVFIKKHTRFSEDIPRKASDFVPSIDCSIQSIDHILTAFVHLVIDRCVFLNKRIDRCVYKKTYKIFRGYSEEGFRFCSIDRLFNPIDRSHSYGFRPSGDRSMRFSKQTHRSMRL